MARAASISRVNIIRLKLGMFCGSCGGDDTSAVTFAAALIRLISGGDGIIHLLRQKKVQNHADNSADGKASLHDEGDGIQETLERPVVAVVGEDVVKVRGDEGSAVAEREACGEDEAAAAVERVLGSGDDGHARDGDGTEEEGRHTTKNSGGDSDERGGELGEDAHDDEANAAHVARLAVRAAREGDDTVVLGEAGHGRDGHEGGEAPGETVRKHTALDARLVDFAVDVETRDVAGGGDVADGLGGDDDVHGEDGEDKGRVDGQREGVHPHKRGDGGGVDTRTVKVTCRGADDAACKEADDDRGGLHDGRAEALAEDDGDEDGEAETEILGAAPGQSMGCADVGTLLEEINSRGGTGARPRAAEPVLEAALDELDADEHDGGTRDDGREHAQQDAGRDEGQEDLEKGADGAGSQDGAVAAWAGEIGAGVWVDGAVAVGVHLSQGALGDGDDGEGDADDGEEAGSDVIAVHDIVSTLMMYMQKQGRELETYGVL